MTAKIGSSPTKVLAGGTPAIERAGPSPRFRGTRIHRRPEPRRRVTPRAERLCGRLTHLMSVLRRYWYFQTFLYVLRSPGASRSCGARRESKHELGSIFASESTKCSGGE